MISFHYTEDFRKQAKHLTKKYRSFPQDLTHLLQAISENPLIGTDLGKNVRKIRMAIASKGSGKRGGARVITFTFITDETMTKIYFLTVYDKSEQDSISDKEIRKLLQSLFPDS